MTKKKLKRMLVRCRAQRDSWKRSAGIRGDLVEELRLQLDLVAPAARGICEPVGIRYETPGADKPPRVVELEQQLAEAKRRLHHAETRGRSFTLVRDVNAQTERSLRTTTAALDEERRARRTVEAELAMAQEPQPDFDPVDEDGCPMPPESVLWEPPPEQRRIGPGDTVYVTDRDGGVLQRVEVESLTIEGRHGEPIRVTINPPPGPAQWQGP